MGKTESKPQAEVILSRCLMRARQWQSLTATWQNMMVQFRSLGAANMEQLALLMLAQERQVWEHQDPSTFSPEATKETAEPPKASTLGLGTEQELMERLKEILKDQSKRPKDLEDMLGVPKERIENVFLANPDVFQRTGLRGWWGLKTLPIVKKSIL